MANNPPLLKEKDKKKKVTIKALKDKVWKAVSIYVRTRDNFTCVTCGKKEGNMDCGHYRHNSERNKQLGGNALWYDLRNLNCQCSFQCNKMKSGNLAPYALYLERKYGVGILQELEQLYRTHKLWTVEELQQKLTDLTS